MSRSRSLVLLLWLVLAASPALAQDTDSNGIPDASDNCLNVDNGPLQQTNSCYAQEDADGDGYGNACDTDVNNNGATGLDDVSKVLASLQSGQHDPIFDFDFDFDGGVGLSDPNVVFDGGLSVIHMATRSSELEFLDLALQYGDPNVKARWLGETPLFMAASCAPSSCCWMPGPISTRARAMEVLRSWRRPPWTDSMPSTCS